MARAFCKRIITVTLELTEKEAQTLLDVTRNIAGDPASTRRKHTNAIRDALLEFVGPTTCSDITGTVVFGKGD